MTTGLTTEAPRVAKTRTGPPAEPSDFERIEFQAKPGFLDRLDRARATRGLSRSAYIRQAIILMMNQDLASEGKKH